MNLEEIKEQTLDKIKDNNSKIKRGIFYSKPLSFSELIEKYATYIEQEMVPYYNLVDKIKLQYNIDNINVLEHTFTRDNYGDYKNYFHNIKFIVDGEEKNINIDVLNDKISNDGNNDYLHELGKCYVECINHCNSFFLDNGIGLSLYKNIDLNKTEVAVNGNFFLKVNVDEDIYNRKEIGIVYDFIKKETTCFKVERPYIGESGNFSSFVLDDNSAVMSIVNNLEIDRKNIPSFLMNTSNFIEKRELQEKLEEEIAKENIEREHRELLDRYHDSRIKTEEAIFVQSNLRDKLERGERIPITQEELFESKIDEENNSYYEVKDKYKDKLDNYDLSLIVWDNVKCSGLDFRNTNISSFNFDVQKIYKKDISDAKFGDIAANLFGPTTNFSGVKSSNTDFGDNPIMLNLDSKENDKYILKQLLNNSLKELSRNDVDSRDVMEKLVSNALELGILDKDNIIKNNNSKSL